MPSANRTSTDRVLDLFAQSNQPITTDKAGTVISNCMKGDTEKRTKRRRNPKKKKNKMLPSRVARLLGRTSAGTGQPVSKAALGTASVADEQLCVLARRTGPKKILCNIEGGRMIATNSASCYLKCGASLCNGTSCAIRAHSSSSNCKPTANDDTQLSSTSRIDRCVAIDCEMVGTGFGGGSNALGRCSIVNYDGEVLYDEYIKPDLPIVDYRTRWSGITAAHMENAIPFYEAKSMIQSVLKGKIVIGHDVQNDFSVLRFSHQTEDIRDTSRYSGLRYLAGENGKKRSVGLKALVGRLLGKTIQSGSHCSVEDARAAMSLYRLVDKQWEDDAISLFPDRQFRSSLLDDHFWPNDL